MGFDIRITSTGDIRITSLGDTRIVPGSVFGVISTLLSEESVSAVMADTGPTSAYSYPLMPSAVIASTGPTFTMSEEQVSIVIEE